jgi:hypothetical protein
MVGFLVLAFCCLPDDGLKEEKKKEETQMNPKKRKEKRAETRQCSKTLTKSTKLLHHLVVF